MNVAQIIAAKRDGRELENTEIVQLICGYSAGTIPDYQMAAFAMAVFFRGMNDRETVCLTEAMRDSGRPLTWRGSRPKGDKHSTGGIGDKTSIPLAPILAECRMDVPMISGRGLGATGGTLDKLESIPGFRTDLNTAEIRAQIESVGCVITGASAEIAPADKRLYALRDVTATVPSIPLITASILSKKLSEGLDYLVLDVKWGSGAFMKTIDQAKKLAQSLVGVATKMGVRTRALITNMDRPLGRMIGNAVEIEESLSILEGRGPDDTRQLTHRLCGELLCMAGMAISLDEAHSAVDTVIGTGRARQRFDAMVAAQAGRIPGYLERAAETVLRSQSDGFVQRIDCEALGLAIIELGGGRKVVGDKIDHGVGIEILRQVGDSVNRGDGLVKVFARKRDSRIEATVLGAFSVGFDPAPDSPLIAETIGS